MTIKQPEPNLLKIAELHLRKLSQDRLVVANDFLAYLEKREENEATQELLKIPGFLEIFDLSRQEAENGEAVSFNSIRRNV